MRVASLALCIMLSVFTINANAQDRDQRREETGGDTQRQSTERREPNAFKPENDRERALFEMIQKLRAEVATLRRQIGSRDGDARGASRDGDRPILRDGDRPMLRDGDRPSLRDGDGLREGDRPRLLGGDRPGLRTGERPRDGDAHDGDARARSNAIRQKAAKIFAAYDKNNDKQVTFEEWLAMREGEMTEERKKRNYPAFKSAAGSDEQITQDEFVHSMEKQARGNVQREGESRRDGDAGPRDGDARRDGAARERGPRDGASRDGASRNGAAPKKDSRDRE